MAETLTEIKPVIIKPIWGFPEIRQLFLRGSVTKNAIKAASNNGDFLGRFSHFLIDFLGGGWIQIKINQGNGRFLTHYIGIDFKLPRQKKCFIREAQ